MPNSEGGGGGGFTGALLRVARRGETVAPYIICGKKDDPWIMACLVFIISQFSWIFEKMQNCKALFLFGK